MNYTETANRLRRSLERAGMKAQELSNKSGIGKSSISQYLSGSHAPSNKSAGAMAAVLGVNPVWLMGFDVPMTEPLTDKAEISDHDRILVDAYRTASPGIQEAVSKLLDMES